MRTVKILFLCHLAFLSFGLGGLLIALPHPELWNTNPDATQVFNFGITYAGSLHIIFGAATVLLFGLLVVDARKTLVFFAASTLISLSMELLGTSTGFPFGPYSYTNFLGYKVAGHVPYSIPLSWFYMGFTSFILASILLDWLGARHRTFWSLVLGAYFLTVWDLALDPAMASPYLQIHFWIWHQVGPYYGMPIGNLVGWSVTGLAFMGVSRLLWRANLETRGIPTWLPLSVYAANIAFAIALDINARLWVPPVMAVVLGLLPASLVLLPRLVRRTRQEPENSSPVIKRISQLTIHELSWVMARRHIKMEVEGLENLPSAGPTMIVARHFHHFYDGCALLRAVPRPLHIVVALDWITQPWLRHVMELACAWAQWPVVLRSERFSEHADVREQSTYALSDVKGYLRYAVRDAVRLLRDGEVLVVFPEAYPNIDPSFTPKDDRNAFLPMRPGFARLAEMAERDGRTQVAIVPAGFTYMETLSGWRVTLRFGQALSRSAYGDTAQLLQAVEQRVHRLSDRAATAASIQREETVQL